MLASVSTLCALHRPVKKSCISGIGSSMTKQHSLSIGTWHLLMPNSGTRSKFWESLGMLRCS